MMKWRLHKKGRIGAGLSYRTAPFVGFSLEKEAIIKRLVIIQTKEAPHGDMEQDTACMCNMPLLDGKT